jgi:hypothetical protein
MNKYVFDNWLHVEALTVDDAKACAAQHYEANGYPRDAKDGRWMEDAPNHFNWVAN